MKFGTLVLALIAANVKSGIAKRTKHAPSHGQYEEWLDVPLDDSKNPYRTYDVYKAKEPRKGVLIVDIHGGAYILSSHHDNYEFALELLKGGYDVALLDYTPNDGKKDTADLFADAVDGFIHLLAHRKEYGLEDEAIVLTGDSAGGHFALLLAEALCDKELAKKLGLELPKVRLQSVMLNCPVYDFAPIGFDTMRKGAMKRMFGPNFDDMAARELLSPRTHIASLSVPLFVSTCKHDFLRQQSLLLEQDCRKLGKEIKFVDIQSEDKRIAHVHNVLAVNLPESIRVNQAMMDFASPVKEKE